MIYVDKTAVETTTGDVLLVELHEDTGILRFLDENDRPRDYPLSDFATIRDALAVDLGANVVLSAEAVACLQQWARIDGEDR